jgi:hypothetical protein
MKRSVDLMSKSTTHSIFLYASIVLQNSLLKDYWNLRLNCIVIAFGIHGLPCFEYSFRETQPNDLSCLMIPIEGEYLVHRTLVQA